LLYQLSYTGLFDADDRPSMADISMGLPAAALLAAAPK
jgi:hypothetical protein